MKGTSSVMDTLNAHPQYTGSGALAMCQKMLNENDATIKQLREENERLKEQVASLSALLDPARSQREADAVLKMRAQLEHYKHVVDGLSAEIVKLKRAQK